MKTKLLKILKSVSSILVTFVVLLCVLLVGVKIFGLQVYTVLSGSMEPEYQTGSIIYVKSVEANELQVGDVITYKLTANTNATHRIIEIFSNEDGNELRFRTKGDANDTADASHVKEGEILGKTVFTIPYLGYIAVFIQRPPGIYITIAISAIIMLFILTVDFLFDVNEEKHKKGEGI